MEKDLCENESILLDIGVLLVPRNALMAVDCISIAGENFERAAQTHAAFTETIWS